MPAPCSHDCKQAFHHTVVSLLLCSALFGRRATAHESVRQSSSGIYILCVDLFVYVYTSYGILFLQEVEYVCSVQLFVLPPETARKQ